MMTKILKVVHTGDNLIATVQLTSSETVEMTGEPLISAEKKYVLPSGSTMDDVLAEVAKDSKRLDGEVESFSKIKESVGKVIKKEELKAATDRKEQKEAEREAAKEAANKAAAEEEEVKKNSPKNNKGVEEPVNPA